jgi:PAS domain S-box-containing protein
VAGEQQATVLIVEDDPGVIRLQQLRLERVGHRVEAATTADEAMRKLRGGLIDLMLLDQNLPGGATGLELYQQVKEAGFDVPAILVTGFSGESIVLQSFRAGVYDFVPKTPDYLDYLLPTIERVLRKRRTESALVESEARLASVIRSALDAVLTVDEQQRIGLFNPAAEQMFGLKAFDAQGLPISRFLPEWSGRAVGGPRPGEQIDRWETEGVRGDGTTFPVELSVSWVEANRRRFWTCVARDVSERRRAQEQRERLIREQTARRQAEAAWARMEGIARENDRLYQELRQVDRLKDAFLAMLAHELRNPLAPIRNALHLIRLDEHTLPPEIRESWAIIDRQVTYLVRLVDDLLDVSRISEGKIQLQKEPLNLAQVVESAVESSQPLLTSRKHTLSVNMPAEELIVNGDPVRLVQVLTNLLNNAAKYTPEGGHVTLSVEREPARAVLRVRDTGMGIAPEILPRLFDLFTQSERTLDRSEGGLGIGLTLVRRLTELHGGVVEATSAGQGKGSEFVVRLPLAGSTPPRAALPREASAEVGMSRRILVVDDNRDGVRTLARLLEVLGHEVQSAEDGAEALEVAARYRPEVILLDIGLPGMDGYTVARQLRARPEFEGTVIVAVTGYGNPDDRQQSLQAGFNAHLVKPVDLEALKQLLAHPAMLLRPAPVTQAPQGQCT